MPSTTDRQHTSAARTRCPHGSGTVDATEQYRIGVVTGRRYRRTRAFGDDACDVAIAMKARPLSPVRFLRTVAIMTGSLADSMRPRRNWPPVPRSTPKPETTPNQSADATEPPVAPRTATSRPTEGSNPGRRRPRSPPWMEPTTEPTADRRHLRDVHRRTPVPRRVVRLGGRPLRGGGGAAAADASRRECHGTGRRGRKTVPYL